MAALLAAPGARPTRCERVNAKYRVGDSLRVVYRLEAGGASAHRRRAHVRRPQRERLPARRGRTPCPRRATLPAVLHAPELETVFWTFPNDRRLAGLRLLDGGSDALDRLVGQPGRPHAAGGLRARARGDRRVPRRRRPRARLREGPLGRRGARARQRRGGRGRGRPGRSAPAAAARARGLAARRRARARAAARRRRLDGLAGAELGSGAARARRRRSRRCTRVRPLPPRRFDRLDAGAPRARRRGARPRPPGLPRRGRGACSSGCGARRRRRASRSTSTATRTSATRCSTAAAIALVDLEDAAAGPAAADLGFVLAGLLAARAQGRIDAAEHAALAAALLGGYAQAGAAAGRGGAALAHRRVGARARRGAGGRPRPARRCSRAWSRCCARRGELRAHERPARRCSATASTRSASAT